MSASAAAAAAPTAHAHHPASDSPVIYYEKDRFFVHAVTKNKISTSAIFPGADHLKFLGKSVIEAKVTVRGDLISAPSGASGAGGASAASVSAAKPLSVEVKESCLLGENTVIRPPEHKGPDGKVTYIPVRIGEMTIIERDCNIQAASIGSYVHIGKGSIIGAACVLSGCCQVLPGTVLAPRTVVPPFTVFGGNPGALVRRLLPSWPQLMTEQSQTFYRHFQAREHHHHPHATPPGTHHSSSHHPHSTSHGHHSSHHSSSSSSLSVPGGGAGHAGHGGVIHLGSSPSSSPTAVPSRPHSPAPAPLAATTTATTATPAPSPTRP